MSVDAETVRRIAHLARIAVEEEEIELLQKELNAILAFVEALKHGPADLEAILYPERSRVMQAAESATVEDELEQKKEAAQVLVERLRDQPLRRPPSERLADRRRCSDARQLPRRPGREVERRQPR